ncbi:MAG: hypothetical protein QM808_00940 [Steroidobacteraceae bacterium]
MKHLPEIRCVDADRRESSLVRVAQVIGAMPAVNGIDVAGTIVFNL